LPTPLPEPTIGINFARENVNPTDWACLVALHSDAWLMKMAFFYAAAKPLDVAERAELFRRMNELPTLMEEVKRNRGGGGVLVPSPPHSASSVRDDRPPQSWRERERE